MKPRRHVQPPARGRVSQVSLLADECTSASRTWRAGLNCAPGRMTTAWVCMSDDSARRTKSVITPVRVQARRLIVDLPHDYAAARDLLRRLRDVGE